MASQASLSSLLSVAARNAASSARSYSKSTSGLYYRRQRHSQDLVTNGHLYGNYRNQKPVTSVEMPRMMTFYEKSSSHKLPLVIGASKYCWLPSVLQNFRGASETPFMAALKLSRYTDPATRQLPEEAAALKKLTELAEEDPDHLTNGNVIFELQWNLALNDSFIQGGIDGNKEICVTSPSSKLRSLLTSKTEIWDEGQKRVTVLGRELISILSQNYRVVEHPLTGIMLIPEFGSEDTFFGIKQKRDTIDTITSYEQAADTIENLAKGKTDS